MGKSRKMCAWGKGDIEKQFDKFSKLVAAPTHACVKCGRVSSDKKALCKPRKLSGRTGS